MSYDISFGSDPEVFVSKDGEIVPAFGFLPTAKEAAKAAKNNYEEEWPAQYVYWDGFQAEFRTGVHSCRDELTSSVSGGLRSLLKQSPEGSKIDVRSVVEIPKEILQTAKQEHVDLGCDPSLNVYGPEPIHIKDSRRLKYRFAGHHFHFGFLDDDVDNFSHAKTLHKTPKLVANIVQNLDATIGLMGVSMFENVDDPIRRKYYGRAGEFRLPKHGIEYRTLSSSVLIHPAIHHLLWDVGGRVVRLCVEKEWGTIYEIPKNFPTDTLDPSVVRNSINRYDVSTARDLLVDCRPFFDYIFGMAYGYEPKLMEFAWKTLLQPVEKTVNINTVHENWGLDEPYSNYENFRFSRLAGKIRPVDEHFYDDRYQDEADDDYDDDY